MQQPTPPDLNLTLSELPRSGAETARLLLGMRRLLAEVEPGDGHPVLTLPGYGGDDVSMATLRFFLRRLGYRVYKLRLGVNYEGTEDRIMSVDDAVRFRERMVAQVTERLAEIHSRSGERVSLVGWSMGGLYAFDAANRSPEKTRMVITMGSPYGDPRGTSMFNLMRWLNRSDTPIEGQDYDAWTSLARVLDHDVPIRVMYSERDGIVPPAIAHPVPHPAVECIAVDSSHVGFAMNPEAFRVVARELAAPRLSPGPS